MDFILNYLSQYPLVLKALVFVGMARAIFKPIMIGIQAGVDASETKKDDELWSKIKGNAVYKWFSFALDYAASIKLPK
jgi:hypothetical protein